MTGNGKPWGGRLPGAESPVRKHREINGVVHHPGRQQPYTLWWAGEVIRFCVEERDANKRYAALRA